MNSTAFFIELIVIGVGVVIFLILSLFGFNDLNIPVSSLEAAVVLASKSSLFAIFVFAFGLSWVGQN